LEGAVDFACMDLSFINLHKVFPALHRVLKKGAPWVALVKPQFEAEKLEVPKGGVILDAELQERLCARVEVAAKDFGLAPWGRIESPIKGRDGNLEFLLVGQKE
jgi:23S rRNA (cytidine1920-2'-O)/16S rRNA (cytidine1409-2'-O)-methyltransferase